MAVLVITCDDEVVTSVLYSMLLTGGSSGATPFWKTAASQKNSPKEESRAPPRPPLRDFSAALAQENSHNSRGG
eukprot:s60_g30.t1